MFFNENDLHQLVKLRQEEIEKKALNTWRHQVVQQESFFQKVVKKWKNSEKSNKLLQNGECSCQFKGDIPCG